MLQLWFEEELGVSIYELDFYPLIVEEDPGEAFMPLRDKERFGFVEGDYTLIWPNPETAGYDEKAIDLAPECVRFFCDKYGKALKAPADVAVGFSPVLFWVSPFPVPRSQFPVPRSPLPIPA